MMVLFDENGIVSFYTPHELKDKRCAFLGSEARTSQF
jgi:hypothetical protein